MLLVEVSRGCPGCRFCAAGFIYRPPRRARLQDLQRIVERPIRPGRAGELALTDGGPPALPEMAGARQVKFSSSRCTGRLGSRAPSWSSCAKAACAP